MKLEQQVCSLELAKKLKELGMKQQSYFYWEEPNKEWGWTDWTIVGGSNNDPQLTHISAFTVAELGEMLPKCIRPRKVEYWFNVARMSHGWVVGYVNNARGLLNELQIAMPNEADARAKMLIYLIEQSLVNVV